MILQVRAGDCPLSLNLDPAWTQAMAAREKALMEIDLKEMNP